MSAPRRRWSLIGVWIALACIAFVAIDGAAARSSLLLLVFGVVPSGMVLSLWNEDRRLAIRVAVPAARVSELRAASA